MKIFLVSVPLEFPLANYCLASQLAATPETAHCEIRLLELDASRLNTYNRKNTEIWRYIAHLEAERPDVVAFSVYLWSHLATRELISITATLYPHIDLLVGGPEVASPGAAAAWLTDGRVTAAIRGEGEITMTEVVRRLADGGPVSGVLGCSWWDGSQVVHEAHRPAVQDLSEFASPYLTGWIPDDAFDRSDGEKGRFPRAFVETYRGCYMQCSYCQWGNGTKSRFQFPQDRVRQELSWILRHDVNRVWIVDAMFGYKKRIAKDLLRHIIEEKRRYGAATKIVCYHNQDFFDHELFDLYREAEVSVEVDLQSVNREVLTRVGRAKWYTDSFERHLEAFEEQRVPTTGAADLIIGLPRDRLETFAESVDYLLRRGMNVNLYQTSMIPNTPMSRTAEEDGTVHSELAPRAVFRNSTFSTHEMVTARLIGHGVDFFARYPRTARLLWHRGFERPVDFCEHLGKLVWERYELMYGDSHTSDAVLADEQELIGRLLPDLCSEGWLLPILEDLFRLEAAASRRALPPPHLPPPPVLREDAEAGFPAGDAWLQARPRFRADAVEQVPLSRRVDRMLRLWRDSGQAPPDASWRSLKPEPCAAFVFLRAPGSPIYRVVDPSLTLPLLQRFVGFFTVEECLDNLSPGWHAQDLSPLREMLTALARTGLLETTRRDAAEDRAEALGSAAV